MRGGPAWLARPGTRSTASICPRRWTHRRGGAASATAWSFPALDLYIHGWDIAKSGGIDLVIPAEAIEFAHAVIDPVPAERVRNSRVFAAERPAPADATASEAFLAWTGRDPAWPASA